ncbi:MAG: hypothetical protein HDR01_05915 [Lachnospiraceae bacterium]|nr:hypothetical protein [Lachnospiraceae bacterium]
MERLTERATDLFGTSCIQLKACGYELCRETCDKQDGKYGCKNCPIEKALEKLAEYEDLEEQGKLLKLPCAVGDTIYEIYSDNIKEHKVDEVSTHSIWIDNMYFDHADIGQNIFLTQEEAQAALSELQR